MPATSPPSSASLERRAPQRREALRALAGLVLLPAAWLGACGPAEEPGVTRVALADLPLGQRVRIVHRGDPVELLRSSEGVRARSLLCTHQGCEVAWREPVNAYVCRCHEGRYDANGKPILGPPTRPLRTLTIERSGDFVVLRG